MFLNLFTIIKDKNQFVWFGNNNLPNIFQNCVVVILLQL